MDTVLWLNIVALALFAWACVFRLVPGYALSHHRYELWRLRDELADDIRRGAFSDQRQPRQILRLVERSIESLDDISTLNMLLFRVSLRGVRNWSPPWDLAAADPADRAQLERQVECLENTLVKHALIGTPSGWLFIIVTLPVAIVVVTIEMMVQRRVLPDQTAPTVVSDGRRQSKRRPKAWGTRAGLVLKAALSSIFSRSAAEEAALGVAMASKRRHSLYQSI